MDSYDWSEIEPEQLNPLVARQMIHTGLMTVARLQLKQGAVVPMHQHHNEQVTMLQQGRLRFVLEGGERMVEAGQVLCIPPDVPHRVEALADSLALDVFSPVREDWRRGEDAYLRES